jgi:site-specific recombinase XerD
MDVFSDHNHNTISIHIRQYLENLKALKYSKKSVTSYKNTLNRFVSFLTAKNITRFVDVTSSDIDEYRLELVDQGYPH